MALTDKDYKEFKNISDKEGITYDSDFEMQQSANNLVKLVELLIEIDQSERLRKRRLDDEPKGFAMAGDGRNCSLCGHGVYESSGWYDKWGFKCLNCLDAVDKKKIPGSLCGDWDHKKCITDSSLSWRSNMHTQTIRKLICSEKIKGRQIPNGPYLILRKDNPHLMDVIDEEKKIQQQKKR